MIITRVRTRRRSAFAGFFGGDPWNDYCDKTYAGNSELLSKCKQWIPVLAPWTIAGKAARGLPVNASSAMTAGKETLNWIGQTQQSNPGTNPANPGTSAGGGGYAPPTGSGTIATDTSSMIFKAGALFAAVGVVAVIAKKAKRS